MLPDRNILANRNRNMEKIQVIDAVPEDASMIADAIMEAVGPELVDHLADGRSRQVVHDIFENLARSRNSQYSYINTRIAIDETGTKTGVCISYDGAALKVLRREFFKEATNRLGWNLTAEEWDDIPEECSSDEFYLDTLATKPECRGKGIGRALIKDAYNKAMKLNKPLGLLVADNNDKARSLYENMGFIPIGRKWFAGEEMTNMRIPLNP